MPDTTLPPEVYRHHVTTESARFRAVLADCDPAASVPSCPDWDAADLLWHLTGVQAFWAGVVRDRPDEPAGSGTEDAISAAERPVSYDDLLAGYDEASAALLHALGYADPADAAWTWSPDPAQRTVGFIHRRQAHEALIHRVDAELAGGSRTPIDPALARDGTAEAIAVMYGGCPPWGRIEPLPHTVRLDLTDLDDALWVQLGLFSGTDPDDGATYADEDDVLLVEDPGTDPDVVVAGTAGDLDAWLWHRLGDDAVEMSGDPDVLARFRAVIGQSIT